MNYEQALVKKMEATTAITNLVGTRIYPNIIPQDASLPAIAYKTTASSEMIAHDKTLILQKVTVQMTVRAATYASGKSVIAALKSTFRGFTGSMGGTGGITVYFTALENELDEYDKDSGHGTSRIDIRSNYKE